MHANQADAVAVAISDLITSLQLTRLFSTLRLNRLLPQTHHNCLSYLSKRQNILWLRVRREASNQVNEQDNDSSIANSIKISTKECLPVVDFQKAKPVKFEGRGKHYYNGLSSKTCLPSPWASLVCVSILPLTEKFVHSVCKERMDLIGK
jgi:hypothetical protein